MTASTVPMREISDNALEYYLERIQAPYAPKREKNPGKFVAYSACLVAENLESKAIVCHTISGTNPRLTSSRRPRQAIYALTPDPRVMRSQVINAIRYARPWQGAGRAGGGGAVFLESVARDV